MIIHLIMLLGHLANGTKKTRQYQNRKRSGEAVVIFCPNCQQPSLAKEVYVERRSTDHIMGGWQVDAVLYACDTCQQEFLAHAFHNDGTGVIHPAADRQRS